MTKEKAIEVAKKYFPSYPSVNTFHVTHDAQVFENAQHADNHARKAFKKEDERIVILITREEAESVTDEQLKEDAAKKEALIKAQENVKALSEVVKSKKKALKDAKNEDKENAQKELEAAQTELQTAEVELNNLAEE